MTEPEVPGDDSDPTVVTPETDVTDDTDAPDPADNAEVDPELLTEAPDSLSVSGTIAIVSDEVAHPTYTGGPVAGGDEAAHDEAGHAEGELLPGRVLVATDEGAVVEIDPALISDDVVTGDRFRGGPGTRRCGPDSGRKRNRREWSRCRGGCANGREQCRRPERPDRGCRGIPQSQALELRRRRRRSLMESTSYSSREAEILLTRA